MNKKTIIVITAILSFSLGQYLKLPSIASTDLQSTGRIIINNPDTGNEEIIFDATDQEKLKNNITANASEILDLKSWQEQQLEINQELSDKAFDLETEISEINSDLGGVQFGIDGDGNYGYYGADDSLIPFRSNIDFTVIDSREHGAVASTYTYTYTLDDASKYNGILVMLLGFSDCVTTTNGTDGKSKQSIVSCSVGTPITLVSKYGKANGDTNANIGLYWINNPTNGMTIKVNTVAAGIERIIGF